MNASLFIKQYKYIIIFLIAIIGVAIICTNNYSVIEKFTCRNDVLFPGINSTNFKPIQISGAGNTSYYNYRCIDDNQECITGFYTSTMQIDGDKSNNLIKYIATVDLSGSTGINDQINKCAEKAAANQDAHFFALDGSGGDCSCNLYMLDTDAITKYNIDENALVMKSIDISTSSTCETIMKSLINYNSETGNDIYKNIGVGGFTSKGYKYLQTSNNNDVVRYYDPLCDAENAQDSLKTSINNCLANGTQSNEDCDTYLERYTDNAAKVNSILGGVKFNTTGPNYECSGVECIEGAFNNSGNYLGRMYQELSNNTIDEMSYDEYNNSLGDYEISAARQQESGMETDSTYMKYFMLIIVVIMTLIMFFLNMTNPDIVTAEIIIGYIVFLLIILFLTSQYFNVDYGPLNRMFSMQLGDAGSRTTL